MSKFEIDYTDYEGLLFIWNAGDETGETAVLEGNFIREAILAHGYPAAFANFNPEWPTHQLVDELDPRSYQAIFNASPKTFLQP